MYKNRIVLISILSLGLFSCQRELPGQEDVAPVSPEETGTISLTVTTPGIGEGEAVKSATLDAERKINSLSAFVFNAHTGYLENYTQGSGLSSYSYAKELTVPAGPKNVWAYANYPVSENNVVSDLPVLGADLPLNDFASGSFPMRALVENVSIAKASTTPVNVVLERVATRVVIKSIKNNLPSGIPVTLVGAYLSDVLTKDYGIRTVTNRHEGYLTPGVSTNPSDWVNRLGRDGDGKVVTNDFSNLSYPQITAWYGASEGLPTTITNGSTYTATLPTTQKGSRLYYIPAFEPSDQTTSWPSIETLNSDTVIPTNSKLVLVVSIDGHYYYYPILLPYTEQNVSVEYDITLTNIGSHDPSLPCSTDAMTVNGSLVGWEEGANYNESPDGSYRTGSITRTGTRTGPLVIAQRLTLSCDVSKVLPRWREGVTFVVSMKTPEDETVYDSQSIKATYDGDGGKWNISYPCSMPGTLTITAKDPEGREIGTYSAPVSKIPQYQITSNASTGIPLDGIIPTSLSISFLGYVNPGNPFFIASAGESSGGRYLDEELVRKYLVPTPQSYSSTAVQQMFSIENGAYTSSTGTTTVPFAGISVKDFVQGDPSDPSDNRMSDIIWEDITTHSGGSANGANAGTITFVNRYGDTSDYIARVENPWYGEYSASGFLKNGFYINGSEMTPRNSIFDYKIKDRNSFHLYTLSRNFKTSMEYGLEWCKTSSQKYCKYGVVRNFGCGNSSPFSGMTYTVSKNNTEISISSPDKFSIGKLNAGGLAYVTAKVSDTNGLYVSYPIGGVTFVKCYLTTISGSTGTSSVTQTVNITPNPSNNSNDFITFAYQAKWAKPSSGGIITDATLKSPTSSSSDHIEIKYTQDHLWIYNSETEETEYHEQDWFKYPQEQMLYYINSGSSVYNPILYTSYNYAKDRNTGVSYPGAWYRFYIGEYPSNITITAGDSPAISNGKDAFNLSSTKVYDTYPVTIKRNDDNLSYDETVETEFVCNLTGLQGTVVGVNSTGTASNYSRLAEGSFSSSTVISLPNSATTKTVYIRGNRTPGFVRMTIYPEGKSEQKRTVVAYNRKDIVLDITGSFSAKTHTFTSDDKTATGTQVAWSSIGSSKAGSHWIYKYAPCDHVMVGASPGWLGFVDGIYGQIKGITVKSTWSSAGASVTLSDITLFAIDGYDAPKVQVTSDAKVPSNASSNFRFWKHATALSCLSSWYGMYGSSYAINGKYHYLLEDMNNWINGGPFYGLTCYDHTIGACDFGWLQYHYHLDNQMSAKFFYEDYATVFSGNNSASYGGQDTNDVRGYMKSKLGVLSNAMKFANDKAVYYVREGSGSGNANTRKVHTPEGTAYLEFPTISYDNKRFLLRYVVHSYRDSSTYTNENDRYWWYEIDPYKTTIFERKY